MTERVELLMEAVANDAAVLDLHGRFVHDRALNEVGDFRQRRDFLFQTGEQLCLRQLLQQRLDFRKLQRRLRERLHIARRRLLEHHAGHQAFKVKYLVEQLAQVGERHALLHQQLNCVQALHDLHGLRQRLLHPCPEHSSAHCRFGLVEHAEQRAPALVTAERFGQFEIAPCGRIELHDAVCPVNRDLREASDDRALRLRDILEQSAADRAVCAVLGEPQHLERIRRALPQNGLALQFLREAIVIAQRDHAVRARFEEVRDGLIVEKILRNQQLGGVIAVEQRDEVIGAGLAGERVQIHRARRDIRRTERDLLVLAPHRRKIVAARFVEHCRLDQRAGRHHADDAALDQTLCECRVLHLLADRDAVAEGNQTFQIGFRCVIRHAAHRRARGQTAVPARQCQLQQLRDQHGIVEKHLVEIAEPEKDDRIPRRLLDGEVLLHHRGELGAVNLFHHAVPLCAAACTACAVAAARCRRGRVKAVGVLTGGAHRNDAVDAVEKLLKFGSCRLICRHRRIRHDLCIQRLDLFAERLDSVLVRLRLVLLIAHVKAL